MHGNKELILKKLKKMKEVSVRDVDPEEISELGEIRINKKNSPKQRVLSLIEQNKNPYVYRDGGVIVKISFSDNGKSLQTCLENYLKAEILMNQ